ncbi:MAG: hypothetical protein O3A46_00220 [Candidatus Poribacteria bacterium]|nr:hypothetical protein [Candidatus Poribacteria bacterium]
MATASYEKMLSRARKYKLGLVLAHQTTSQIPLNLVREILGNVACVVGFVVSHDDATRLSKEFLIRREGELKHVAADELVHLRVGEAFCKIGNSTVRMNTYLADQYPDHARAKTIIERSRQNYGVEPMEVAEPARRERFDSGVAAASSRARSQKSHEDAQEQERTPLDGFDPGDPFDA